MQTSALAEPKQASNVQSKNNNLFLITGKFKRLHIISQIYTENNKKARGCYKLQPLASNVSQGISAIRS